MDLADVVIDNHGAAGDASITIEGVGSQVARLRPSRVRPSSTPSWPSPWRY